MKNMRFLQILFLCIFSLCGTSCSDEQILNFVNTMVALDEWSPSRPMTIFVYPFKPEETWDSESVVGLLAWGGLVFGVQALEEFSSGKVKYLGNDEDADNYRKILAAGTIYGGMAKPDADKKAVLHQECIRRGSEAIMYGVYNKLGDTLRLTVYLYVKKDNLIIKERETIVSTESTAESVVKKIQAADNLDNLNLLESESQLVLQLLSKSTQLSSDVVRKYLQGSN